MEVYMLRLEEGKSVLCALDISCWDVLGNKMPN